jgi:hypothetical protein
MATMRRFSPLLQALGVTVLLVVLARPLLFDGSQRGADYWVHFWYVWHQAEALRDGGPSLYIHDTPSLFVPRYAFYGGTLYAITGALGLLAGSILHAYMATYLLGCAAAYGGWWWLGRQAGLSRLVAHAPALVFVTSAYAITLLNPRSDWPEHIGVSMLPLLAASGLSVLRADRLRLFPMLAFAVSTVVFTGSHNLTLLFGTTLLVLLSVLLLLVVPSARRLLSGRGVLRLLGVLVPAVLVNAWFLLPDIKYQSHTSVANLAPLWKSWLGQFDYLVGTSRLFSLERGTEDSLREGYGSFALPVLAMAWVVVATVVSRPRLRDGWLRTLLVLAAVTTGTIVVMTHVGLLRGPFAMVQYSFRLESYVNLTISGAVLAALVLVTRHPGRAANLCLGALAAIVVVSVVQAAGQISEPRDASKNFDMTANPTYYSPNGLTHAQDYAVGGDLPVTGSAGLPQIIFPVQEIKDGSVTAQVDPNAGTYFVMNLMTIPQFVKLEGATPYAVDPIGNLIVQLDSVPGFGPSTSVTVSEAPPPAARTGRWLSVLGLLGLAANVAVIGVRWWRRRRRAPTEPPPGTAADDERAVALAR